MAKIKTLTSMARGAESIKSNQEIDLPDVEAIALCVNGLAEPVGWTLPADPTDADGPPPVDPPAPSEPTSKKKK